jgi:hypothetical protein
VARFASAAGSRRAALRVYERWLTARPFPPPLLTSLILSLGSSFGPPPPPLSSRLPRPPPPPPLPSPLPAAAGVKNQIEEIVQKLQDHDEMLSRIDASMEKNANLADDSLKAVQASLKASLASLRDEMNRKLQAMTIEIAQLQKQMNVQRGEQNILAQQSKDTTKRLEVVAGHVTDLAAELHGDEAHVAVAGGATY